MVPIGDGTVTQLRVDWAFTIVFQNGVMIRIETQFSFVSVGVQVECDPSAQNSVAPLLALHGATANEAIVSKVGDLAIRFADGAEIQVPHHGHYEAFGISGPTGSDFKLFSLPGGEVSVFS